MLSASLAMVLLASVFVPVASPALAQDAPPPSINLSVSGSASLPAIGIAPTGRLHALWWDQLDGTRYARGTLAPTQTVWSQSVVVPGIVGLRRTEPGTKVVTLRPPTNLQLQVDGAGAAHAVWLDNDGQLMYSQASAAANATWSTQSVLAAGAAGVATSLDISGTLRIAFIQTSNTQQSPSGVYYLVRTGNTFRRSLAYASTYFRTAKPDEVNLSVASDVNNAVIAWYQAREGGSFSVRTADGGKTWSQPEPLAPAGENTGMVVKVVAGIESAGKFLLMWRDASAPSCGLFQKQSADAGQTWSMPQRVLTSLTRCPEVWQMIYLAGGQVGLIGTPSATPTPDAQSGVLAFWNGNTWSQPADVTLLYQSAGSNVVRAAGCIGLALSGNQLATIGCDLRGDVWASVRPADAGTASQTAAATWTGSQPLTTADSDNPASALLDVKDVDVAVDQNGAAFVAWAMAKESGQPPTVLQMTTLNAGRWSEPKDIIRVSALAKPAGGDHVVQTAQPSLAVGSDGKLHLVWSGGESGRIFYSAAFMRDALDSARWQTPLQLPAPSPIGSSPQIIANRETGRLSVLYAVPYNEGRGVYLTQSTDGGATWLTPTRVFDAMAAGWDAVGETRLAFDAAEGTFHALWLKMPLPGASGERELFYAQSKDAGRVWSQPVSIDSGQIEKSQVKVIAPKSLLVTWQKQSPTSAQPNAPLQVWWRASPFGGENWTPASVVAGLEAVSGEAGLETDGAGRAYLAALGQGISGEASLFYTEWGGSQWNKTESTSLNQPATVGNSAALAVLNNDRQLQNVMRLSTLQQNGRQAFGIVANSRNVQAADMQALPTFTPAPPKLAATPAFVLPDDTPEPTPAVVSGNAPAATGDMPMFIVLGVGLALVVLVGGIVMSFVLSRRR